MIGTPFGVAGRAEMQGVLRLRNLIRFANRVTSLGMTRFVGEHFGFAE